MLYVNLGSAGVKVSRICLGMMTYGTPKWRSWVLDEECSRPFIKRALDSGINFFDTADMYSLGESEAVLGRALKEFGPSRDRVVIATKVNFPMGDDVNQKGLSRKHIHHAIDASLKRLGTDYVDLYQIHRLDPETPIEEILDALNDVIKAGKALYIGASSMYVWQFAKMVYTADRLGVRRFSTMQNHYNIVYREEEREMIPFCRDQGIGVLPWSPLARGFIAGNRKREGFGETARSKADDYAHKLYYQESDFEIVNRISAIAQARGVSNAQIALAWILHQPGVTSPIVGASKLEQLDDLVKGTELKLTAEELQKLSEPYRPHPVLGHN